MLFEELTEIVDLEPHDAALNMAIDEALLRDAAAPTLRIYQWRRPAVSFGYFGKYASVASQWPDRELVRRWTGGGTVPHGSDVTYTLIVPREAAFAQHSARESYRLIHEEIAAWLAQAGHRIGVAQENAAKISDACFENPVAFDLVAGGLKIAGAAQRRSQTGILHQGSISQSGVGREHCEGLASALAPRVRRRELGAADVEKARILAAQKYGTEAWLKKF